MLLTLYMNKKVLNNFLSNGKHPPASIFIEYRNPKDIQHILDFEFSRGESLVKRGIKIKSEERYWDSKRKITVSGKPKFTLRSFLKYCIKHDYCLDDDDIKHVLAGDYQYVIDSNECDDEDDDIFSFTRPVNISFEPYDFSKHKRPRPHAPLDTLLRNPSNSPVWEDPILNIGTDNWVIQ